MQGGQKAGAAVQIEKKQARQGACEAAGFSGGCARREMRWVVRMGGDGMRRAQVRLHGWIESGWCRDGCGRSRRMQACLAARLRRAMRWEASGRSMRGARTAGNGERGRLAAGDGREAGPEV